MRAFPAGRSGPGYPFIRLQALGAGPVSTAIPNAGMVAITHPDYAALVDPLFAFGGKRVGNAFILGRTAWLISGMIPACR